MDTHEIYDMILAAEREAAELMLSAKHILAAEKSGHRDVVTEYDRKVQELLVERFSAALPEAKFYCEESETKGDLNAETVFIIDPIDGTMNFLKGFNHSCISVACASRGEVLCAAVYNPYKDEMFSAVRDVGAWLNGRAIRVDECHLRDSVVCVGTAPYCDDLTDRTFSVIRTLFDNSLDIRREGSAALDLCSVAAGRAGLYRELSLCTWDYAAGWLIVTEAGGECRRPDGSLFTLTGGRSSMIAGCKTAVEDYFRIFGKE